MVLDSAVSVEKTRIRRCEYRGNDMVSRKKKKENSIHTFLPRLHIYKWFPGHTPTHDPRGPLKCDTCARSRKFPSGSPSLRTALGVRMRKRIYIITAIFPVLSQVRRRTFIRTPTRCTPDRGSSIKRHALTSISSRLQIVHSDLDRILTVVGRVTAKSLSDEYTFSTYSPPQQLLI